MAVIVFILITNRIRTSVHFYIQQLQSKYQSPIFLLVLLYLNVFVNQKFRQTALNVCMLQQLL